MIYTFFLLLLQQPLLRKILSKAADSFHHLFASVTDHFELCLAKCRTSSQVMCLISASIQKKKDRNPGTGYNILLLRLIPGYLLSAFPYTVPYRQAALSNSYPYACVPCREAVCTIFMMVFGMPLQGRELMTNRMRGTKKNRIHFMNILLL